MMGVTEIRGLTRADLVTMARAQADAREPLQHHFEVGSREACTFERAYHERAMELLQDQEG